MSELKCPFCQQELDTDNYYIRCRNPHCDTTVEMEGTEEIWEVLIRTCKALEIAVDELTNIKVAAESVGIGFFMTAAISALVKIKTTLEQKDVK